MMMVGGMWLVYPNPPKTSPLKLPLHPSPHPPLLNLISSAAPTPAMDPAAAAAAAAPTSQETQEDSSFPPAIESSAAPTSSKLPLATISLSFPSLLSSNPLLLFPSPRPSPPTLKIPSQLSSLSTLSLTSASNPSSSSSKPSSKNSNALLHQPLVVHPRIPADPSNLVAGRRCTIVWFRADLRVHDNEALAAASSDSLSVLPVYLFDPRDYGRSPSGFDRTGPYRAAFLIDSVADLRRSLQSRGSDLVVRVGRPETVLVELVRAVGADAVYAHREVSHDEVVAEERVEKAMEKEGVEVKYFWGSTLYHLDDLPFELEQMPLNYGGFRERVNGVAVRRTVEALDQVKGLPSGGDIDPGEIPKLMDLGLTAPPAMSQDGKPINASLVGGETEALERLKNFAAECRAQPNKADNKNSRDSIYGANFSCKISPWLAMGCLSPRFMFEELKKTASRTISATSNQKNAAHKDDNGMNWLMFELLWRDFFRFITKKYSSSKKQVETAPATACTGALACV